MWGRPSYVVRNLSVASTTRSCPWSTIVIESELEEEEDPLKGLSFLSMNAKV